VSRLLFLALVVAAASDAAAPRYEARVRSSFLVNFVRFVEWPDQVLGDHPLRVCAVGDGGMADELRHVFHGRTVHGHAVEVRTVEVGKEGACHVLYVSHWQAKQMDRILSGLGGTPVLTVSDAPGFAGQGGMVELTLDGTRVRFVVNREAALRSGLRISSQLLRMADAPVNALR
jgi:hypothetical protein